jgi:serine/threonine protein kinase
VLSARLLTLSEPSARPASRPVLQELRHPHIVRLRETVPHKDTLVLVFDFAAGGDLELLIYPPANAPEGGGGAKRAGGGRGGPGCRGAAVAAGADTGCGDGEVVEVLPPLPPGVIKAHMKALLEALAYCHEQVRARPGSPIGRDTPPAGSVHTLVHPSTPEDARLPC